VARLTSIARRRVRLLAVSTVVLSILAVGVLLGSVAEFPAALAQVTPCQVSNGLCSGGTDLTKTASLTVYHNTNDANVDPVEPDDGETWNIKAYWNTAPPSPCFEVSETASVEVSWNGTTWELSNTSTTTNIVGISVCHPGDLCSSGGTSHDFDYELIVDLTDPVASPLRVYNLRQVVFTTTSMDDGYVIDDQACTLGSSVTPSADSFTQTDLGPFECAFDCTASGPSVTITYD